MMIGMSTMMSAVESPVLSESAAAAAFAEEDGGLGPPRAGETGGEAAARGLGGGRCMNQVSYVL
jgi:hypothetical protein